MNSNASRPGFLALAACALLFPAVIVFASKGLPVFIGLTAILALADRRLHPAILSRLKSQAFLAALPLAAIALVSLTWAPNAGEAAVLYLRLVLMGLALATLLAAADNLCEWEIRHIKRLLLVGGVYYVLLLLLAEMRPSPLLWLLNGGAFPLRDDGRIQFNAAIALFVIFFWIYLPPMKTEHGKPWRMVLLLAPFWILTHGASFAPFAAFMAALATTALLGLASRLRLRHIVLALALAMLALPFAVKSAFDDLEDFRYEVRHVPWEVQHRLWIWDFTARHIQEKPILGWGFNASRGFPGGNQNIVLNRCATCPDMVIEGAERLPLHSHNAFMQIWLELGLLGVAAYVALLYFAARSIDAVRDRAARLCASAAFTGYAFLSCVSYGVWQNWWICALAAATALGVTRIQGTDHEKPPIAPTQKDG